MAPTNSRNQLSSSRKSSYKRTYGPEPLVGKSVFFNGCTYLYTPALFLDFWQTAAWPVTPSFRMQTSRWTASVKFSFCISI